MSLEVFNQTLSDPNKWSKIRRPNGKRLFIGVEDSPGIEKVIFRFDNIETDGVLFSYLEVGRYWRPTFTPLPLGDIDPETLSLRIRVKPTVEDAIQSITLGWMEDGDAPTCGSLTGLPYAVDEKPRGYKSLNASEMIAGGTWEIRESRMYISLHSPIYGDGEYTKKEYICK